VTPKVILVVDSDGAHRRSLSGMLDRAGHEVRAFADGSSAWRSFQEGGTDAVILDLLLPDMSGVDLAEKITLSRGDTARVPIILMSDLTLRAEWMIEPMKRGGISLMLSKPVSSDDVLAALSGLFARVPDAAPLPQEGPLPAGPAPASESGEENSPGSEAVQGIVLFPESPIEPLRPSTPPEAPCPSSRRMLLADDNPVTRQIVRRAFNPGEFLIETAANGEEALRLLESEPPDIVLLDVNLPGKSGFEILDVIRGREALSRAAVVFLREPFEKTDERRLKDSRVDGLIQKPLKSDELTGRVRDILEAKSGRVPRR
jgi:two-component system copper resistance phosphate regulon response regulator CusR